MAEETLNFLEKMFADPAKILREVVAQERIGSDEELIQSIERYNRAPSMSGDYRPPEPEDEGAHQLRELEERRARVYLISQLVHWLYPTGYPNALVEVGSAGDITAALALPNTQVISVDNYARMFASNPHRVMPKKLFERLGRKKDLYLNDLKKDEQKKLDFVKKCIPNWRIDVSDARQLQYRDNTFDIALTQGPIGGNFENDVMGELTRVTKPGGYIMHITTEQSGDPNGPSAYVTNEFGGFPGKRMVEAEQVRSLGLEKVEIPDRFKKLEKCATWTDRDGIPQSGGRVFQIFRKS